MSNDDHVLTDALETPGARDRVHFANGQLLDAQDFRDEQDYHRSRLARSLAYAHGPGTVAGARVEYRPALAPDEDPAMPAGQDEELRVLPGLVIDRIGRLIEIPRAVCLRVQPWYDAQSPQALNAALALGGGSVITLDVFVRFRNCGRGRTPAFQDGPGNALDKVSYARVRDGFEVQPILRSSTLPEPPLDPWAALAAESDPAARLGLARDLVLDTVWREDSEHWANDMPPPGREHDATQDPTSVFLARVGLRAAAAGDASVPPARELGPDSKPVVLPPDNASRLFVFPTAALRHLLAP